MKSWEMLPSLNFGTKGKGYDQKPICLAETANVFPIFILPFFPSQVLTQVLGRIHTAPLNHVVKFWPMRYRQRGFQEGSLKRDACLFHHALFPMVGNVGMIAGNSAVIWQNAACWEWQGNGKETWSLTPWSNMPVLEINIYLVFHHYFCCILLLLIK